MAIDTVVPQNLANFDAVLKDYYIGPIRDVFNSKTVLLNRLARDQESISGRVALIPINVRRNEGHGFVGDSPARLPDPGRQSYETVEIPMSYFYCRTLFSGPTVAASRNSEGAFARVVDAEMRGMVRDGVHAWNRVLFGDGSGRLAQIDATNPAHNAGAGVYGVENPGGFDNPGPGTQYLRVGMRVAVFDEATNAFRGSSVIEELDGVAQTITLAAPISGAAGGEYIYTVSEDTAGVPGALPAESWGRFLEPVGLAGMFSGNNLPGPGGSTRPYLGIDAETVPVWRANDIDANGAPLDLDMLQMAEDTTDIAGDGRVTVALSNHYQRRALFGLLVTEKRFVNSLTLNGGWKALEYNDFAFVVDKDATSGRIYFLDEDPMAIYQMAPIAYIDDDGHVLHRLPNTHAFQVALYSFWTLGTSRRNTQTVLTNLQEAA